MTNAITTMYNGISYRSRLEARWAAFFRFLQMHPVYEPVDLDGWIPDFGIRGALVEIKPCMTEDEFVEHELRYSQISTDGRDVILLGVAPDILGADKVGRLLPKAGSRHWKYTSLRYCPELACRAWDFIPFPIRRCPRGHTTLRHNGPDIETMWTRACTETQWKKGRP